MVTTCGNRMWSLSDGQRRARDYVILALVLVLVLCISSLSSVLYYTTVSGKHVENSPVRNCTTSRNCTTLGNRIPGYDTSVPANFSRVSWSESYTNGSTVDYRTECYTGSVCSQQLMVWQEYALGRSDDIYLYIQSEEYTQDERERDAAQFLYFLQSFGSEACQRTVGIFACQNFFPLLDCKDGEIYEASQEECERLSIVECEEEWTSAQQHGINLPMCDSLPTETADMDSSSSGAMGPELPPLNITQLSCKEDFFEQNFTCLPRCDLWRQNSPTLTQTVQIVRFFSATVQLLASTTVVIIFVIRHKTILVFPTVFLMYFSIGLSIQAFFNVVSAIGGSKLFCSSMNLIEAAAKPNIYCTIQGAAWQYTVLSNILCWFFHISFLFYTITFPFSAMKTERYKKWIHLISVSFVVLLPTLIVTFTLAFADEPYNMIQFPPRECWHNTYVTSLLLLPVNILITLGICMFIIIAWIIRKVKKDEIEKKPLLILLYYVIYFVFVLNMHYFILSNNPILNESISDYFLCEATGHIVGKCSTESFEKNFIPFLWIISDIMYMFLPIVNLLFVINFKEVRKKIKQLCQRTSEKLCQKTS